MAKNENIGFDARYFPLHAGSQVMWVSQDVDHEDADTIEFNRSVRSKAWWQDPFIYIPANRRHRRQRLELVVNLDVANISRMKNVVDSCKQGRDPGIEQSVCI